MSCAAFPLKRAKLYHRDSGSVNGWLITRARHPARRRAADEKRD
jgi:hypothetical protein